MSGLEIPLQCCMHMLILWCLASSAIEFKHYEITLISEVIGLGEATNVNSALVSLNTRSQTLAWEFERCITLVNSVVWHLQKHLSATELWINITISRWLHRTCLNICNCLQNSKAYNLIIKIFRLCLPLKKKPRPKTFGSNSAIQVYTCAALCN